MIKSGQKVFLEISGGLSDVFKLNKRSLRKDAFQALILF